MTLRQMTGVCRGVVIMFPALLLCTTPACPRESRLPFSRYRLPGLSEVVDASEGARTIREPLSEVVGASEGAETVREPAGDEGEYGGSERGKKTAGAIMFGSGVLLCSWGIVDWQTDDTQCCPARNTENVAKLLVGVVLVNAGLVYLIAGGL